LDVQVDGSQRMIMCKSAEWKNNVKVARYEPFCI
jgi:hypothetical protein